MQLRERSLIASVILALAVSGCDRVVVSTDTGLTGTARYGPTLPVCHADQQCDAPLVATFDVLRSGHRVATFATDANGRFSVFLAPGSYTIHVTSSEWYAYQDKSVTVAVSGLTVVTLNYDTGIR